VAHYRHLASDCAESDSSRCKAYLQKAVNIQPRDLSTLEMLFEVHRADGNDREAIAVTRSIVQAAKSAENPAYAIDLLYKLINFYPEECLLFHELAEIHLLTPDVDAAVECLRTVAQIYERRKDMGKLRKTYTQLARLKPNEASRFKRLAALQNRTRLSFRRVLRLCAAGACTGLILTALAFVGITEYFARALFAQVVQDVETQKQHNQLELAEASLRDFQETFPFSTRTRSAQALMREVSRLADTREEESRIDMEKRQVTARSNAAWVKIALKDNDYLKASDLLKKLDVRALRAEEAKDIGALTQQLNKYFSEARELLRRAQVAESRQEFSNSWDLRKEIIRRYPYSRAAQGLLLPILLETLPPGADVIVNNRVVGQTPKHLSLPIRQLPPIVLSKRGYQRFNLQEDNVHGEPFHPSMSHHVRVRLLKNADFKLQAEGSIEGFPAVRGEHVYFGTRNGKILCVRQDTGKRVWAFEIPGNMDLSGGLGLWNNLVYFGSYDGHIYVLDATSGEAVLDRFPASPERWPIKHAPSGASEKGLVAVNCDKKLIMTYNVVTGKPGWSMRFPTTRVLGQPQAFQGQLYFCTQAGEIIAVDHETGSVKKRVSLGFDLDIRGRLASGQYFVGNTEGKLLCLDHGRNEVLWTYDCGEPITSAPTVAGELVVVPTESGVLHCVSTSGEFKWRYETAGSIYREAEGVLFRNNFLIGTAEGRVLCLDIWSGQMVWSYETQGFSEKPQKGILSSGAVSKGRFFVGSEDHSFYAFPVD
jgi:outer membrane protein assembly factor BamB